MATYQKYADIYRNRVNQRSQERDSSSQIIRSDNDQSMD